MKQGRRRLTRRVAMVCGSILAGVLISWLVVLGLGISIPLDSFRHPIETAASRVLGRPVHIGGALLVKPALVPTIVAHDVRIASPTGQGDLLRSGRVAVRLAPVALLRGELRGRRLLIEDASIDLDSQGVGAHGTVPAEPGAADGGAYARLLLTSAELLARQPDLRELVLQRMVLNYPADKSGRLNPLTFDEVSLQTRPGQALGLVLRGRVRQQPYTIDLHGGPLKDLLTPGRSWPLQAEVSFADSRMMLDGKLEASSRGLAMSFELRADWPAEFARFGQAPWAGRLALRADQGRPVVTGELQLPVPDAVLRFTAGAGPAGDTSDQTEPGGETLAHEPVAVPLTVSIADVPFHGQLLVDGQGEESVLEVAVSATDVNAGSLMTTLTGTTTIRGRLPHIGLQASVRGSGETRLVNRMALALQVDGAKLSFGNSDGERPLDVTLDKLALSLPAGEAVMMQARGTLLGESFSAEFTAGGLQALLAGESWPIRLSATGGGAVLDISGPLAAVHADTATRLHVGLYGARIGDLAAWLGVSPCAATSYTLRGQLVLAEDIGRLQFLQLQMDRTRLNGELDWSGYEQMDLLHAVLHFEELDPADIEALIPLVSRGSDETVAAGIAIDIPVLPRRVEIDNADIDLVIAHILPKLVGITEVSLSARIRDGRLLRSPFHAQIGNAGFQGYLDPATKETAVVFENEDSDSVAGGRMDKLFSNAMRWVGSTAVVPLRWILRKKFSAADPADCQLQGDKAGN